MSITATDLLCLGSASRPEDDVSTSGGAIDATDRPVFADFTGNQTIRVRSDGADTRTITITGRLATGAVDTEALVLNGVTAVNGAKTFERILKVVAGATDATRTVTVETNEGSPQAIGTIPPNETGFYRLFLLSASEAAQAIRYEKIFWKNNHGTLTLNSAAMKLTADPSAKIRIGVAASKGDTGSVANRKTSPGVTFVDDNVSQSVPTGAMAAGETIGVWIEQTLAASDTPYKSSFTTQLSGTSV